MSLTLFSSHIAGKGATIRITSPVHCQYLRCLFKKFIKSRRSLTFTSSSTRPSLASSSSVNKSASLSPWPGSLICKTNRWSHGRGWLNSDDVINTVSVLKSRQMYSTTTGTELDKLSEAPLSGIRILDMSRILAGPYATMILGDLGADVIKVEKPGNGDDTRDWGPPFMQDESVYFMSVNRNKKSICVDFKRPEGGELIRKLAAKSDVLIENFLPGKLASMGLGYQDLQKVSPGLIYCSITGYGPSGPYANRGGYDVVAAAVGGFMHVTGPEDGDPCRAGVAITDITTGLYAHGAIMAALIERQRTGKGKKIDCSLLATQVAVLSHLVANYLNAGIDGKRYGTGHASLVPYQVFKTSDGGLVIGAGNNDLFILLCKKLNMEYLVKDERFLTNALRVTHRKELISLLEGRLTKHDTSYWIRKLAGTGLPVGPINSFKQVFEDPQVKHLNLIQELKHPTAGDIKVVGPAVQFDETTELRTPVPSPGLGQHTREILRDVLELSSSEINELLHERIVTSS